MSERRPDPPDPRASLVDSGWSEPAPAKERELPSYGDSAREHIVTRVDDQIQARIAAMNYDDRTDVSDVPIMSPPPPPPPPLPPPALPLPQPALPPPALPLPQPRLPSRPPPPPRPPPMSAHQHLFAPMPELSAPLTDERTVVDEAPEPISSLPPTKPQSLPPPQLPPQLPPIPRPPSFAPMPLAAGASPFVPPPSLREALAEPVRVGGSEIPLWGIVAPAIVLTGLFSALLVGFLSPGPVPSASASAAANEGTAVSPSSPSSPAVAEATTASPEPASGSLLDRARSGDEKALTTLEQKKAADRGMEEALAVASGRIQQELSTVGKLRARLAADPGLAKDPKILADLRRMGQDPDTSRDALAAMAALPGPLSADLLYEVWTSTAERSNITELAQSLLMGRDVRPKASPALAVALDLRQAETCEENAKILDRAIAVGDKRAFAPLSRLLRHNGCGPTKKDDCYPCIREGERLKQALTATKLRREPEIVRRDNR